ncbi:NADP-dependent oxidoreductase [Halodesulfurarchaeum sp. HSR-GB]|uniref:NADP-dependent oxidoreductase n=1 Tax=Halodesulfurarchaeum sp. HSR-GB TaxID=3074077 RepID=UPI002858747F|nr:NADP-dependent oxidoreductase [Halodesulfurarchaeum sp. HSR-GB]MDR5657123.1 NADP-dependent oxidoreductase [Halodesulfurarchaeum sp. HSR-GB]
MPDSNREWVFVQRPSGEPGMNSFELREGEVPETQPGELLVHVHYLSVDPYMRGRMRDTESYAEPWNIGEPMEGAVVGEVIESNSDAYDVGDLVTGMGTWADYSVLDAQSVTSVDSSVADLPAYLGVLGMPGRTAYFGLLEVGDPKPGDTVVVSGAAGAVGSVVGQIANLNGCHTVGFAGSDEKVKWLTEALGFDAAINYKAVDDYRAALDEAAPDGVDVYFDNVGGPITDAVFTKLNLDARVAVCGQIAHYNDEGVPTGPRKLPQLIPVRAKVQGLLVHDYLNRFETADEQLLEWVAAGEIDHRESIVDGLENAPNAFLGLFSGENIGKQVVAVSEPASR